MDQIISSPDFQRVSAQDPVFAIRGGRAKIQGRIEVEDQLEIECEVNGEILCTGKLIIGVNGHVTAGIQTVDAVIRGRYDGDLIATGSVEIAQTARVKGTVDAPELAIARGAIFKGTVSRPDDDETDLPPSSPPIALPAAASRKPQSDARVEPTAGASDASNSASSVNGQTRPAIQEVVVLSADAFAPSRTVTP